MTTVAKTRIVDLKKAAPRFTNGPELYDHVRYPTSVVLPNDTVLTTNGAGDYRGKGASDILKASIYDPKKNAYKEAASPLVGRNYHSGGLLLPDGRVMTFGSNSLFADKANTKPAKFEQRIELYTPPYLNKGKPQPQLESAGQDRRTLDPGDRITFRSKDAASIKRMRLVRPGSFTHVTNVEQSSVALDFKRSGDKLTATVPDDASLVPPGWWMTFAVDDNGIPSKAQWVKVRTSLGTAHVTTTTQAP